MSYPNSILGVVRHVYARMPQSLRFYLLLALAGALLVSISQLAVISMVALLGATLSSPETVVSSARLNLLWTIIPKGEYGDNKTFLGLVAICAALIVVGNNILSATNAYGAIWVSKKIEKQHACQLLDGLLHLPYEWYIDKNNSDMVSMVSWTTFYGALTSNLMAIACDILSILVVAGAICVIDPIVGVGCVLLVAIVGFGLAGSTKRVLSTSSRILADLSMAKNRTLFIGVLGIRDIKLFGRESSISDDYSAKMEQFVKLFSKQELIKTAPKYLLETLGFVAICASVLYMLATDASSARIAGTMALVAAAGWRLLPCIGKTLNSFSFITTNMEYLYRVERCFADIREVSGQERRQPCVGESVRLTKEMRLKGVTFCYHSSLKPALTNINLIIPRGGAVGIVGSSGSGKSTLMDILCGLYFIQQGSVEIDGRILSNEEIRNWQVAEVGYVSQTPYICDGTLAENIAFGLRREEIDQGKVLECCKMAAIDFLDDLNHGINTRIGDNGVLLSGGQRQRVAIARALYHSPEVLVFDEATSSLDTKSELAIQQTIFRLKGNKTLVIVAHRLSTVEGCDVVYWIDKGQLKMSGAAAEVLAVYRKEMAKFPEMSLACLGELA